MTVNKIEEENQVQQVATRENKVQQVTTKEPQQVQRVTTKNPKKVEAGKRLPAHNCRKREELKAQAESRAKSELNQYYSIKAVIAARVIGGLGYYIYQTKKGDVPNNPPHRPPKQPSPQTNKFEMD